MPGEFLEPAAESIRSFYSMHRRYRLRRSTDFELLLRFGKQYRHHLGILIVRANGESVSRFGFSTSKRLGKATVRNRAKRRMREVVRPHVDRIEPGWDLLFIARKAMVTAEFSEINYALCQLLNQAGLLQTRND